MILILRSLALALVLVGAVACSDDGDGADGGSVDVVASFYPLAFVAEEVGGDRVRVTNLTPAGSAPHDFEPTPREVERVNAADVVFYLGAEFQPAVADLAAGADNEAVDLLDNVSLRGDRDPHVWLAPQLMAQITDDVRDTLTRVDPEGSASYARNAQRLRDNLDRLASEFDVGLESCERNIMVVPHASFEYLAAPHQLEQEAITGTSPEAEPDPARMARLVELVRDGGITTIFVDPLEPDDAAQALARQTNTKTAPLSALEGLTEEQQKAGDDYFSLMRRNLAALRDALSCP